MLDECGCRASQLHSLMGMLKSMRIVTRRAALHYRGLQYQPPRPGRQGVFLSKAWINFSKAARWANSFTATRQPSASLTARSVSLEVWTDASGLVGWGGHCLEGHQEQGQWTVKQEP